MKRSMLSEAQVKKIIQEELFYHSVLYEGIWDDVQNGAKRLIGVVTKNIASSSLAQEAKKALASLTSMPEEASLVMQAIKAGMKETGESLRLDDNLKLAKQLGTLNSSAVGKMLADDLKGPVHDKASSLQAEATQNKVNDLLFEMKTTIHEAEVMNEAGVLGVVGLTLAGFGLSLMLIKGLEKLAKLLHATKIADLLHKVYHVLHTAEGKAIDYVIPDKLSYYVYKFLRKSGFKLISNKKLRPLTYDEYIDHSDAREKTEKLIYSAFLLFLAFNGVKAAVNAGISLLGFAEGGATVVKGVEIGQAAGHISDIIELGNE